MRRELSLRQVLGALLSHQKGVTLTCDKHVRRCIRAGTEFTRHRDARGFEIACFTVSPATLMALREHTGNRDSLFVDEVGPFFKRIAGTPVRHQLTLRVDALAEIVSEVVSQRLGFTYSVSIEPFLNEFEDIAAA